MTYVDAPNPGINNPLSGTGAGPAAMIAGPGTPRDYDIERRLALLGTIPELNDPEAVMALATSDMPTDQLVSGALGAVDAGTWEQIVADLSAAEEAYQRAKFATFSPERQRLLIEHGYKPVVDPTQSGPRPSAERGGVWGVVDDVGGALSSIPGGLADFGGGVLHGFDLAYQTTIRRPARLADSGSAEERFANDQLRVANSIAELRSKGWEITDDQATQLAWEFWNRRGTRYRDPTLISSASQDAAHGVDRSGLFSAEMTVPVDNPGVDVDPALWDAFNTQQAEMANDDRYNPSLLASWGRAGADESWITPSDQLVALGRVQGDWQRFELAWRVARGDTIEEILTDGGIAATDPRFAAAYEATMQVLAAPDMTAALEHMGKPRGTFGQILADTFNVTERSGGIVVPATGWQWDYQDMMSGGLDFMSAVLLDPTLLLGAGNKARLGIMYSLSAGETGADIQRGLRASSELFRARSGISRTVAVEADAARALHDVATPQIAEAMAPFYDELGLKAGPLLDPSDVATAHLEENYDQVVDVVARAHGHYDELARTGPVAERTNNAAIADTLAEARDGLASATVVESGRATGTRASALRWARQVGSANTNRSLERIAQAFRDVNNEGDEMVLALTQLRREMPSITPALESLIRYDEHLKNTIGRGIESADDLYHYLGQADFGFKVLAGGHFGSAISPNLRPLPYSTGTRRLGTRIKMRTENMAWWLATADEEAGVLARAMNIPVQGFGKMLLSMGQQLPRSQGLLDLRDWEEFARVVHLGTGAGMGRELQQQYLERFMRNALADETASLGSQVQLVREFVADLHGRLGLLDDPDITDNLQRLMARMDPERFRYAPDGLDLVTRGTARIHAPVLVDVQQSSRLVVPIFGDVIKVNSRNKAMKRVWGALHHDTINTFMGSYWSPAMVMKLGFIPRAAGEETLAWIARVGAKEAIQSWAANTVVSENYDPIMRLLMGKARGEFAMARRISRTEAQRLLGPEAFMFTEVAKYRRYTDYMRAEARLAGITVDKLDELERTELLAHWVAGRWTAWHRRSLAQLLPREKVAAALLTRPEMVQHAYAGGGPAPVHWLQTDPEFAPTLEFAQRMMRDPVFARAFAESVDGRHMATHGDLEDIARSTEMRVATSRRMAADPNVEYITRTTDGTFHEFDPRHGWKAASNDVQWQLAHAYDHIGDSELAMAGLAAYRGYVPQDVLASVLGPVMKVDQVTSPLTAINGYRSRFWAAKANTRQVLTEIADGRGYQPGAYPTEIMWSTEKLESRLPPALARYAADAPEGSPLRFALNLAASNRRVRELLETLMVVPEAYRPLLVLDASVPIHSDLDRISTGARDLVRAALDTPDGHQAFVNSDRSQFLADSTRVQYAPPESTQTFYGVTAGRETIEAFTEILHSENGLQTLLGELSPYLDERGRRFMRQALLEWDSADQVNMVRMAGNTSSRMAPLSTFATDDRQLADQITRAVREWEGQRGDLVSAQTGITHVPQFHILSSGSARALAHEISGILPDAKVWRLNPTTLRRQRTVSAYLDGVPEVTDDMTEEMRHLALARIATGPTELDAKDELAQTIVDYLDHHFVVNGEVNHQVLEPLVGERFGLDVIQGVDPMRFPSSLVAPRIFNKADSTYQRMVAYGWEHVIGGPMSALIRRPMFTQKLAEAYKAAAPLVDMNTNVGLMRRGGAAMAKVGIGDLETARTTYWALAPHQRYAIEDGPALRRAFIRMGWDEEDLAVDPEAWDTVRMALRHDENVEAELAGTMTARAITDLVPFIDDNRVRSYFSGYLRNLAPFYFAQEQFFKRWAKTFAHSPEGLRRAQLIALGFKQSAIVEQNERGEDVIVLPLSESASSLLANNVATRAIFGEMPTVPVSAPLTMTVNHMLPGVGAGLWETPSLGPLVAIPAGWAAERAPQTQPVLDFLQGPRGTGRSGFEQVLPSWFLSTTAPWLNTPRGEAQITAATIGAMQMMESESIRLRMAADEAQGQERLDLLERAELYSTPDGSDPHAVQAYVDEVQRWSEVNVFMKGIYGFLSPGGATIEFPDEMTAELTELMEQLPFDEAMTIWLSENPTAGPYSVFATTTDGSESIAPTEASLDFMRNNRGWLEQWGQAGPWLVPTPDVDDDTFNQRAWLTQMAMGFRRYKTPDEWVEDLHFAGAAPVYFDSLDRHNAIMATLEDPTERSQEQAQFDSWAQRYKTRHPLFASQLTGEARTRREETIAQLEMALADPLGPELPQREALTTMVTSYQAFRAEQQRFEGDPSTAAGDMREQSRAAFSAWGERYIVAHPELEHIWRSLIEQAADLRDARAINQMLTPAYIQDTRAERAMITAGLEGAP